MTVNHYVRQVPVYYYYVTIILWVEVHYCPSLGYNNIGLGAESTVSSVTGTAFLLFLSESKCIDCIE